jgi:hypothetical protein
MNPTESRRLAEQLFRRQSVAHTNAKEREALSREVQRKIEYLRQLRLAVQAQRVSDLSTTHATDFDRGRRRRRRNARAEN